MNGKGKSEGGSLTDGLDGSVLTNRKKRSKKFCSPATLTSKLPVLSWLPGYTRHDAVSDAIAGVTVGLTVIPQGIAYALIAGLPPQYGLYSAFMGCFFYIVFGSSKDITIGPTAIMALMTGQHAQLGPDYAVLLAFISGLFILLCGLLRLGFLIDFISVPVIAGFTSAAAITIASSQVKSLLGLKILVESHLHHLGIIPKWIDVFTNIQTCRWQDAILGLLTCAVLLGLRSLNRTNWLKEAEAGEEVSGCRAVCNKLPRPVLQVLAKFVWFICTARNAIVVILCLILAMVVDRDTFTLTSEIDSGLPAFQPPPFSVSVNTTQSNSSSSSDTETHGLDEMLSNLGAAVIIIPLIAILESVAIAKAFAKGKPVDASQEMLALGLCNLAGSFVQSMPVTGSFSRTAVNAASGVRTAMGGLYTGLLVLLCLAFLMPYTAFIPKATLAGVIITAVIFSVEHHVVKPIWSSKKMDLIPGFACFLVCLFCELEFGIGVGVLIQIMMILYTSARPKVEFEVKKVPGTEDSCYLSVTPHAGIVFPAVTHVRALISQRSRQQDLTNIPVVVDCDHLVNIDYTAAAQLTDMMAEFSSRQQPIFWLRPDSRVANTVRAVAGDLFVPIAGAHQVMEDQRDGKLEVEEEEPQEEKKETDNLVEVQTEQ